MTPSGELGRLQAWYLAQCDGEWEHGDGIRIETLDNPGWMARIELAGTAKSGVTFEYTKIERSEHDWLHVFVRDNQLQGACGPKNLTELLTQLLDRLGA